MQTIKYQCRVEKILTNHEIVKMGVEMPMYTECVRCLSCGVMGVVLLDKESAYDADL